MSVLLRSCCDLDAEAWVLTEKPGQRLLAEVTEVPEPRPADISRWRKLAPPHVVAAAVRLAACRARAQAKFSRGDRMWLATRPAASPAPLSSISVRGSAAIRWPLRKRQRYWPWIPIAGCAVDSPGTPPFTRSQTASYLASRGPRHSRFRRVPGSTLIPIAVPRDRSERDAWPVTLRAWSSSAVSHALHQPGLSSSARPATSRHISAARNSRSS